MKFRTFHNRVEMQEFILSTSDVRAAVLELLERRKLLAKLPAHAREEVEIDLCGDSHEEAATLTRRFIYDAELIEGS